MSEWKCPKCGAPANDHGKGGAEKCKANQRLGCSGMLCECDDEQDEGHGDNHANPCRNAYCYHCGWGGTFPVPLKGVLPWERKAIAAGWTPPAGWEATKKGKTDK